MCVLYRSASADSVEFADYCAAELGVPRCNLVPLPNATADETLADYATFQAEVENDLAAWLALNPTVAANVTTFLVGYGVPGCFTHAGVVHSAASRLMHYGSAFSSGAPNPLYNPSTVERLTATALSAAGVYLACRIDADTLAHAKEIVNRQSSIVNLQDADTLYSDDAAYLASLPCQRLRIVTAALGEYANDAFVFGDTGTPSFGAAGSRVCFVDDSADAADTLRAASELFDAIVTNGYAAGLGFSSLTSNLSPLAFFEMLRVGGTLAEAFCVAIASLDYTAVPIGSPLMTVAFQLGGYNVYLGKGSPDMIDWDQAIAYTRYNVEAITINVPLMEGQKHVLAARAVSHLGVEEHNTHVLSYVELDAEGNLLPRPMSAPSEITTDIQGDGSLVMSFSYRPPTGFAPADAFEIFSDGGTGTVDLEEPVATLSNVEPHQTDFEVLLNVESFPVKLAARGLKGEQNGPLSRTITVALSPAPLSPVTL